MSSASNGVPGKVDRICIIGAGPSGLAAAKYLLAERKFSEIVIYEQRDNAGGLWNHLSSVKDVSKSLPIPQTEPYSTKAEAHTTNGHLSDGDSGLDPSHLPHPSTVISPVYDLLETNIPRGLMGFSDLRWDNDCQLFPGHETVLDYLERYAEGVRHLIKFGVEVVVAAPTQDNKWKVVTRSVTPSGTASPDESVFDAVLVASGHFDVPYIPAVKGVEAWHAAYPGRITHSKFYRRPEDFRDQKCIVVGNSASGVDIGAQIATACRPPLLQSQKSESFLQPDPSASKVEKPEIVEYIVDGRQVRFSDGTVETNVDAVVYCTGYFYSYPFLRSLQPPLISTGEYVENLYQHVFYRPNPSLAFVALNQKIIPFPVAEAQSAVIARVWSGRLSLPSNDDMEDWEQHTLSESGGGRSFHVLQFPKDADYINMMHDWALSAEQIRDGCHEIRRRRMSTSDVRPSVKKAVGKEPPYWGEKEYWIRSRFPSIKKAFQGYGEARHSKRTLEDVGFNYEKWKQETLTESKQLL